MKTLDIIRQPVQDEYLDFRRFFKDTILTEKKFINIILNYILKTKGKELRPIIVLLSARLVGEINEKTYVSASMIELLHTASLVHDDVVDNSQLRRGKFSVKALWQSKLAVLVGDYLLARGLQVSVRYNCFDTLAIVSEAVQKMTMSEIKQLEKSKRLNITEEDYFEIIEGKTASLLVASACAGASSVDDDAHTIKVISEFAKKLGLAFQIKDDLLDYSRQNLSGKPSCNDIQESKMTLPLIHVLSKSEKSDYRKIKKILSLKNKKQAQIEFIRDYVFEKGGIVYAEEKLQLLVNEAKTILNSNFKESEARNSLNILVDFVMSRKK